MHFIALVLCFTFSVTARAQESAVQQARSAYKAELIALQNGDAFYNARTKCDASKIAYLVAVPELSAVEAELKATEGTPLGQVQASYRTKLTEQKKSLEATIALAKVDAIKAGAELEKAQASLAAIEIEIDRISKEEASERDAVERTVLRPRVQTGAMDINRGPLNLDGMMNSDAHESYWPQPSIKPLPLPAEFKACFPSEVSS